MFVYIARHAWAYHYGDPRWSDDSQRELEPEGADRYMRVVTTLAERGFAPEVVATSPYARCRQTADIIAQYTGAKPKVVELDSLAPASDLDAVLKWTRDGGHQQVCWVGHAPDVTTLAANLIGDGDAYIRFAKGAIAAVRFDGHIERAAGELYWLASAKSLGL